MKPRRVVQRADKAALWEAYVAGQLARKGYYVLHMPMAMAEETGEPIDRYLHCPDITIHKTSPSSFETVGEGQPAEVKSTRSLSSIKVGSRVFLCSLDSFNRKARGLGTYADFFIVDKSTHEVWWVPECSTAIVGKMQIADDTFDAVFVRDVDLRPFKEFPNAFEKKESS